jgi:transposase
MAIIRAILAGERDPEQLAALCHPRIQATPEEVAKSLEGNWRAELLFALEQEVNNYDHYQHQMAACDQKLQIHIPLLFTLRGHRSTTGGEPWQAPAKLGCRRARLARSRSAR